MTRQQTTSISLLNGWTLPPHPPVYQPVSDGCLIHLSWDSSPDTCYRLFQDGVAISPFLTTHRFATPYPADPSDPLPVITIQPTSLISGLSNTPVTFPPPPPLSVSDTQITVSGCGIYRTYTRPYIQESDFNVSIESITEHSFSIEVDGHPPIHVSRLTPTTEYTVTIQIRRDSVIVLSRTIPVQTTSIIGMFLRERQLPKTFHHSQNARKTDFRIIRTIDPLPDLPIH
jgi:hypothetical protein